jgi:cobalt/nickel transport system ATP-binding protein
MKVFSDTILLASSSLCMLDVLGLYCELLSCNLIEKPEFVTSVLQLIEALEQAICRKRFTSTYTLGTITLFNVDTIDARQIYAWIAQKPKARFRAMGTRAKICAEHEKIPINFTYGVIDKYILGALIGELSLNLIQASMVPQVSLRAAEFAGQGGTTVKVITFPGTTS